MIPHNSVDGSLSRKPSFAINNLRTALRHPSLIVRFLGGMASADLGRRFLAIKVGQLDRLFHDDFQAVRNGPVLSEIAPHLKRAASLSRDHLEPAPPLLYTLIRLTRPSQVLETGVHFGSSTSLILHALTNNVKGSLTSVDLPEAEYEAPESKYLPGRRVRDTLPPGTSTGFLVSPELRERWTLRLGKTQDVLAPLLAGIGPVDLFFRDSEHTYDAMWFEFETAWRHLRPGGFLVSDNVDRNDSFQEFAATVQVPPLVVSYVGVLQKPRGRPSPPER